jgi:hypothetical protein
LQVSKGRNRKNYTLAPVHVNHYMQLAQSSS